MYQLKKKKSDFTMLVINKIIKLFLRRITKKNNNKCIEIIIKTKRGRDRFIRYRAIWFTDLKTNKTNENRLLAHYYTIIIAISSGCYFFFLL